MLLCGLLLDVSFCKLLTILTQEAAANLIFPNVPCHTQRQPVPIPISQLEKVAPTNVDTNLLSTHSGLILFVYTCSHYVEISSVLGHPKPATSLLVQVTEGGRGRGRGGEGGRRGRKREGREKGRRER